MNATTTTGSGRAVALPNRLRDAQKLAAELHGAQVLGATVADVWSIAEGGKAGPDAWTAMLALAVDLTRLAGFIAPTDETAGDVAAVADALEAAVLGGPITLTTEARAAA